jgi:hypothetical protein
MDAGADDLADQARFSPPCGSEPGLQTVDQRFPCGVPGKASFAKGEEPPLQGIPEMALMTALSDSCGDRIRHGFDQGRHRRRQPFQCRISTESTERGALLAKSRLHFFAPYFRDFRQAYSRTFTKNGPSNEARTHSHPHRNICHRLRMQKAYQSPHSHLPRRTFRKKVPATSISDQSKHSALITGEFFGSS